jgi:hypothetical protein
MSITKNQTQTLLEADPELQKFLDAEIAKMKSNGSWGDLERVLASREIAENPEAYNPI